MIFNCYNLSKLCLLLSLMAVFSTNVFAQNSVCNLQVKFENIKPKDTLENVEIQVLNLDKQIIYRPNPQQTEKVYENVASGNLIISVFTNTSILDPKVETNKVQLDCNEANENLLKIISVPLPSKKTSSTFQESKLADKNDVNDEITQNNNADISTLNDNSKGAIHLEKPSYPKSARAANITGTVNVRVIIDSEGTVIYAKAISGHPLLRNSAENAAVKSMFKPTLLEGKPVEVSGIIIYNFN